MEFFDIVRREFVAKARPSYTMEDMTDAVNVVVSAISGEESYNGYEMTEAEVKGFMEEFGIEDNDAVRLFLSLIQEGAPYPLAVTAVKACAVKAYGESWFLRECYSNDMRRMLKRTGFPQALANIPVYVMEALIAA